MPWVFYLFPVAYEARGAPRLYGLCFPKSIRQNFPFEVLSFFVPRTCYRKHLTLECYARTSPSLFPLFYVWERLVLPMESQLPLIYGLSFLAAALAFAFAVYLYLWVKRQKPKMQKLLRSPL